MFCLPVNHTVHEWSMLFPNTKYIHVLDSTTWLNKLLLCIPTSRGTKNKVTHIEYNSHFQYRLISLLLFSDVTNNIPNIVCFFVNELRHAYTNAN